MRIITRSHSVEQESQPQPATGDGHPRVSTSDDRVVPLVRVVIEGVRPELDAGRHPVKRVLGDRVEVAADIYKDGHDQLAARILYRPFDEATWREAPLEYHYNPDRWLGGFRVDRIGRWLYTLEAWPDLFRTWRSDLDKRLDVGQDVRSELLEGAALLERIARRLAGSTRERVNDAVRRMVDDSLEIEHRLTVAFSDEILQATWGPVEQSDSTFYERTLEIVVDRPAAGFAAWYELFPRSQSTEPGVHGTFADVERRLPDIATMGFDVLYLPPIHPIGHTHRKGKNNTSIAQPDDVGSPWAIGSEEGGHCAVEPKLGTIEDFERLVRAARDFGIEVALDYALQCSPDHPWVSEHPDWFFIRRDGTIQYAENPPKKYEDIYPLNFWCVERQGLWQACRDIFLFWIARGVKTFRVDNPHTKPLAFWEWAIRDVQARHPDVVFLSESFTRPTRMKGLAKLGFTQSYTYFTWKNTADELREYLTELTRSGMHEYYRPNFFANTPDILHEYLQSGGRAAFRVRLLLAATLSPVYGIYSGFELCENAPVHHGSEEYLDSDKYQVLTRDWNAPGNIKYDVGRLNHIRRENPALQQLVNLEFLDTDHDHILAYRKYAPGSEFVVVVNLDPHHVREGMVHLPLHRLGIGGDEPFDAEDLLTGAIYTWRGPANYVRLDPAERAGHLLRIRRRVL
jgi:starch synthase (maltosyl-transferring)